MASESPEDTTSAWEGNEGYGGAEYHQASHTEQHSLHQPVQERSTSIDPAFNAPGESPSPSDVDEDGDEYDPESITITTTAPAPVAPSASKKRKKAGGFIVGSSDDEDDTPPAAPSNTLKPNTDDVPSHTFSHSPLQQSNTMNDAAQVRNGHGVSAVPAPQNQGTVPSKSRLPADVIGILEDRVNNDPRGDMDAWLSLIEEHRRRNMILETRAVYERFLKVFPQSAEIWVQYLDMELSLDNFSEAERIFQRTLMSVSHVQLWTAYLNYIRRRNDLNDPSGQSRQVVSQSYEFVLDNIGQDRDSGHIWQDYIQFIRSGPGQIGGNSWQDMQKMDVLRKAYQRAICIPMANLNTLWKEYDQFELGLNKVAGRKFLQERSPSYMSARGANTHLDNIIRGLQKTTLPRLPPASGFDGERDYLEQVELWKKWIAWEKDDPLVLKNDEPDTYRSRILHVYKQALMAVRFWPEMWVDAAEWCFENNIVSKDGKDAGLEFLVEGVAANPESSLLALKHADRIESTHPTGEGEDGKEALGLAVRAPYDKVLDTLYDMVKKLKDNEVAVIAKIENDPSLAITNDAEYDEDEGEVLDRTSKETIKKDRIKTVQDGFAVQIQMLSQQISYLWIALVRAFRRIQGQGKTSGGVRAIFMEARKRGRLTSDVYVAIAHIEGDIYQDPVATKIFERGAKLFPEDEHFMVAYLKHLHSKHDTTNARVVFSQTVKRFKEKPELAPKLKPLYAYFHGYEAKNGELAQIKDLEKQMAEAFPEDPALAHFSARFSSDRFNPIATRVIISPATQMQSKNIMQSIEQQQQQRAVTTSIRGSPHPSALASPKPQFMQPQGVNSPKRPFIDEPDDYSNPPRKMARGVSPLKGAAGRRLDQQRRAGAAPTAPISRDITFLLGLIPPAHQYDGSAPRYRADAITRLIRDTHVPDFKEWQGHQTQGHQTQGLRTDWRQQQQQPQPAASWPNQWDNQQGWRNDWPNM
ncbi:uncharacterized protein BCR38DRAFT_352545 [Pseudomassariella vexata]|uniref:mRNA 3'-end-processing protein RNA14 n=1 Tax=Pseudomassariella vexata TaxID=1141098 RepID=A0A1Y2DHM7_9PEZI|nr:uncharacterized protein BCR38DRAFT_352545 [Pseudomassariella vexata]ORY58753.1 hypothetical protein BCR38DRAFT_352545 [Pseudomassariella vexata]